MTKLVPDPESYTRALFWPATRHRDTGVQKQTLCRDESWAMVPIRAPNAACTQNCRLCTDYEPRSHPDPTISQYMPGACIFHPLINSHHGCLGVYLAGNTQDRRQTKGGSHEHDQCRRNAGDGASSTALGTRQSSSPLLAAMPFLSFSPILFFSSIIIIKVIIAFRSF